MSISKGLPGSERELHELIAALQHGRIDDSQHKRLDQLLTESEAARRVFYDCIDIDLELRRRFAAEDPMPSRVPAGYQEADLAARKRPGALRVWSHLAVIAATAAAVLVIQHLGFTGGRWDIDPSAAALRKGESYLATLTRSADCVWGRSGRPLFDGQRLLSDALVLESGLAEFRFDSGVRVLMEGPASLTIESPRSALLSNGRVVLHGSEAGDPFQLHTPTTTLIDIGTEYGAAVRSDGVTEVHVFEGEVSVESPRHGPTEDGEERAQLVQLSAGEAGRFDQARNRAIELKESHFVRAIPEDSLPNPTGAGFLLAYEPFDYEDGLLGRSAGGSGWDGGWRAWLHYEEKSVNRIGADGKLGNGNCLRIGGRRDVSWRTLSTPVRLDRDAVYYVSFLIRKLTRAEYGIGQYGSLSLRSIDYPKNSAKLSFGMSSESHLSVTHSDQQMLTAPPLPFDEPVLIVAKIVSGATAPDQVMVRWYGLNEEVSDTEPHTWTAVSSPSYSDAVLGELSVRSGGDVSYLFDEIRVAKSWSAAVERVASMTSRIPVDQRRPVAH